MNLQEQISRIQSMMEHMGGKYIKPTSEVQNLVYKFLNRYAEGSEVYHIKYYDSLHHFEWCKDGRKIMLLILNFDNNEDVWDDTRKMEERPFENGDLFIPKDKFKVFLDTVPIRVTYLSHLILQWFEDTKLNDVKTMIGRDDIDVDELNLHSDRAPVCVPPQTRPDDVTVDEMIDYIAANTLWKKEELKTESDEWIEKLYLEKLRKQKEKELGG
jgi:hypothetical protein